MKFKEALKESVKHLSSPNFRERVVEEDERMLSEIDILCEINKQGFLTHDSQSGRQDKGKHYIDKKSYTINERAYILGFMLKTKASSFLKNMSLQTDKIAMIIPVSKCEMDIPVEFDIPLTISKHSGEEKIYTHMSTVIPQAHMNFQLKESKINKTEPVVFVFCFDPQWNRYSSDKNGLFNEVLKILKL
jgi:hypothetical protein